MTSIFTLTVEPYLSSQSSGSLILTAVASILFLSGIIAVGCAIYLETNVGTVIGFIFFGVSFIVFTLAADGDSSSWAERSAAGLSERYGVEVTEEFLTEHQVEQKTLQFEPYHIPLEIDSSLKRDSESGSFTLSGSHNNLYLLVDGQVLEVMVRNGDNFTPYVPADLGSGEGS